MKNTKNTLLKWVLGACMLVAGVQSAMAQCTGTAYIRVPAGWPDVFIYYGNTENEIPATAHDASSDYYVVDLAKLKGNASAYFEVYTTKEGTSIDYPGVLAITKNTYNKIYAGRPDEKNGIKCPGTDNSVYIMDDPTKPGTTYVGDVPSGAKYFHVLIPDNVEWQADQIMINIDGKKDTVMTPSQDLCGWVTMVFENAPSSVYLYRKNNPTAQLGLGGLLDALDNKPAVAIDLAAYYEAFGTDELYFIPDDDDWLAPDDGGWYISDPGVPEAGDQSRCSFTLAALIYDTDESVNSLFSHDGGPDIYGAAKDYTSGCVGVHHGIVNVDLDPITRKPVFSGSANAKKCFGSAAQFNTLFNYTQGVNEVQCYDLPFRHYGTDTRWGYDSDSAETNGLVGGFSPLEESSDIGVVTVNGVTMGPLAAARTKRAAAGPVPTMPGLFPLGKIPDFDHYCNTPGWSGGVECEGKFDSGDNPADFWCWGNYCDANFKRWGDGSADLPLTKNEKRNQQFCFESHATFVYAEDQEFTFRGDDDIWVFINNKIAVDNGGAHLAAPGHVVLKNLNTTYGAGFLVPGEEYPLDIFFCDRRTTMSNVIIKTNMYIRQKTSISAKPKKDQASGTTTYEICYNKTGDASCAAAISSDGAGEIECCGNHFTTKPECAGFTVEFKLDKSKELTDAARSVPKGTPGFDLSNPSMPVLNPKDMVLGPGTWYLFAIIDGKSKYITKFRKSGEVDVVYGSADVYDDDGDKIERQRYEFVNEAMAGEWIPIYVSAVVAASEGEKEPHLQPTDAIGVSYNLDAKGLLIAAKDASGTIKQIGANSTESRTIGESGVDTLYVSAPLSEMTSARQSYSVVVSRPGGTPASIQFYLPKISFVDSTGNAVTGDPKNSSGGYDERWVGGVYQFDLQALKPNSDGSYSLCETCNFAFVMANTSPRIESVDAEAMAFKDGKATISVRALKEYRYDPDTEAFPPAVIGVGVEDNPLISAKYSPIYFREPPVPYPVLADVFDVKGQTASNEMAIPEPYFSSSKEYLDGIGDSVVIYYNRLIAQDSLPIAICIEWDSVSATPLDPVKEGFSSKEDFKNVRCNEIVTDKSKMSVFNCNQQTINSAGEVVVDKSGKPVVYCDAQVQIKDLALSKNVKTRGVGKVYSFAEYEDKGKVVKQGFNGSLTDRMAPVVVEAIIESNEETMFDNLVLTLSEPVELLEGVANKKNVLDFYLNSAIELTGDARYISSTGTGTVMEAAGAAAPTAEEATGNGKIRLMYKRSDGNGTISPQPGDYVRLGGSIANILWKDVADINGGFAKDSAEFKRGGSKDSDYNWNSPTGYAETIRLPSPWVTIVGQTKGYVKENKFASTGNASPNSKDSVVVIRAFPTTVPFSDVLADPSVNGIPGHFIHSDMYSTFANIQNKDKVDVSKTYISYEVNYFTNLGAYVAGQRGKIYCDDAMNKVPYFNGGKCTDGVSRYFYIGWNMRSDNGREVGTGAYIAKIKTVTHIGGNLDKPDKNKHDDIEETSVWGIRKSATPSTEYLEK